MLGAVDAALSLDELSVVKVDVVFELDPPLLLEKDCQLSNFQLECSSICNEVGRSALYK